MQHVWMRGGMRALRVAALVAAAALIAVPAAHSAAPEPTITFPGFGDDVDVGPLQVRGTLGQQEGERAWVVYAVDVSGSTSSGVLDCDESGRVDAGDDFNRDGSFGDTLDCEIAGVIALNTSLAAIPGSAERIRVGLVPFGSGAAIADVGGSDGQQDFVSPTSDLDDNDRDRAADIVQAAASLDQGVARLFAPRSVGTGTNFDPPLTTALNMLEGKSGRKVVFLLTDGFAGVSQSTLDRMRSLGVEVRPYAIGAGSDRCAASGALVRIGAASGFPCVYAPDPTALRAVLAGQPPSLDRVEVRIDFTGTPTIATVDPLGNFAADVVVQRGFHHATVTAYYRDGTSGSATVAFFAVSGVRYVALGDSYSAGEGITPYEAVPGAGQGCHQGPNAYPRLIGRTGFELPGAPIVNVDHAACSGAILKNVTAVRQSARGETHIVQLDRVDPGADLVTLTIGGNDAGFSAIGKHCATQSNCMDDGFATLNTGRSLTLREYATLRLTLLEPELRSLFETLRVRTGDSASIVAMDYPEGIDDGIATRIGCFEEEILSRGEREYLNSFVRELGATIGTAADAAGVWFADVIEEFKGHRVCDGGINTQGEWLVGADISAGEWGIPRLGDGAFHPDEDGHEAYARVLTQFLRDRVDDGLPLTAAGLPANPGPPVGTGVARAQAALAESAAATAAQAPDLTEEELAEVASMQFGDADLTGLAALRGDDTCATRAVLGQHLVVRGYGFAPGTSVRASMKAPSEDAPRSFSQTLTADAGGTVAASLIVPSDLQPLEGTAGEQPWTAAMVRLAGTAPESAPRRLSELVLVDPPGSACDRRAAAAGDLAPADGGPAPSSLTMPGVPTTLLTLGPAGPTIDIVPGTTANEIEPGSNQVLSVVLRSTPGFDATAARHSKMRFGHDGTEQTPMGSAHADADGDGDRDQVLRFMARQTRIACGDTIATLRGVIETKPYGHSDDLPFRASDRVTTVGC